MMIDLSSYLDEHRAAIDTALHGYFQRFCLSERMRQPVEHAVSAGGKRIRPILCISACTAVGGAADKALPPACALEMIHTYSLIHDDLPALDNDDLRRGKPTCHIQFGEAAAILAGDALLTMAFETLAEAAAAAPGDEAGMWLRILGQIAQAAGCRGMIEGQARDLAFEGVRIDRDELEQMHRLKTGALIAAAVRMGAVIGGGTEPQIARLGDYASHIGLAFQVVDDILNVKGDVALLGKAVGTDQLRLKSTYPALLGLEGAQRYAAELIDRALLSLDVFDTKADPLRAIARYIVDRNR